MGDQGTKNEAICERNLFLVPNLALLAAARKLAEAWMSRRMLRAASYAGLKAGRRRRNTRQPKIPANGRE